MEQVAEEIRLGQGLAQEFGLSPDKNSFTSPHPLPYYYGVFCACTNRPLPERTAAKRTGHAESPHAYEVLKLGFSEASQAMGRPLLAEAPPQPATRRAAVALQERLPKKEHFQTQGRPTMLMAFLIILGLAVLLFFVQNISLRGQVNRGGPAVEQQLPPLPGSEDSGEEAPPDGSV